MLWTSCLLTRLLLLKEVRCLSYIDGDVVVSSFVMQPHVPPLWIAKIWSLSQWTESGACASKVDLLPSRQSQWCRLVI